MRFLRTYGRVIGLLGRDLRIAALLTAANLAFACLQFIDPLLFGRVVSLLAGSDKIAPDALWFQAATLLGIWGAVGVAASYAVANYVVLLPLVWISTGRRGPVSCRDLIRLAMPHVAATLATAAILMVSEYNLQPSGLPRMAAFLALAYFVYLCVILFFDAKRELFWRGMRLLKR